MSGSGWPRCFPLQSLSLSSNRVQGRIGLRGQSNSFIRPWCFFSLTEMSVLWSSLTLTKGCWMEMSWDGRQQVRGWKEI